MTHSDSYNMATEELLPFPQDALDPQSPLRSFGSPGASLTWGIGGIRGGVVSVGLEGEKMTAKILDKFVENPYTRHLRIFHSAQWPGSNGDTDHILVMGKLVILIDSKRWKGKRKYSVTPKGAIMRGTVRFPEGKVKMIPAMNSWRKILPPDAKVLGVVAIAQKEVFVPYDKNWYKAPFRLVTAENLVTHLVDTINREQKKNPELIKSIHPEIIKVIGSHLVKPRDRQAELINLEALDS